MKNTLIVMMLAAAPASARAATNSALDCLRSSAVNGSLAACLNENAATAPGAVFAGATDPRPAAPPAAGADKGRPVVVPTPTGYASAEEGTLKAGFFKGLDSGFKSAFMAIEYLPVLGIEASGGPNRTNAGTVACTVLGVILSIPASIVGVVLGAPLGAAAGMIAEKVSPGSTKGWFTF